MERDKKKKRTVMWFDLVKVDIVFEKAFGAIRSKLIWIHQFYWGQAKNIHSRVIHQLQDSPPTKKTLPIKNNGLLRLKGGGHKLGFVNEVTDL